jgi:hypothetical protein
MYAIYASIASVVSACIAACGLFFAWRQSREGTLRRADVSHWAEAAIDQLQSLLLICVLDDGELDPAVERGKLTEIMFAASTLTERGRLFFKNEIREDGHGQEKESAYQGYRPKILDQLVVAHQIARHWPQASPDDRKIMLILAEDAARTFVSLAQREVGRSKTASAATKRAGDGRDLDDLVKAFNRARLEQGSSFTRARAEAAVVVVTTRSGASS